MDDQSKKSKFWKFALWFVAIIVAAVVLLWALGEYQWSKNIEAFERWVESTERAAEEFEARKAADTYGGATPQETLRMYIEAVERGDYELASKYFVLDKQEEWNVQLENINQAGKLNQFLAPLKLVDFSGGEYSSDKKSFSTYNPVGVDFSFYSSGVWKIVEI